MKKAVLFDLGKVLLDFDKNAIVEGFRRSTSLTDAELMKGLSLYSDIGFEKGEVSAEEFYQRMKELLGLGMSFEEFREVWCDIFSEVEPMVDFWRKIRGKYGTYIASNTDPLHMPYVLEKFPWLREFDGYGLSYELRVRKPDPEFFRRALEKFSLVAEDCVYIDDIEENAAGARSLGIDAVVFKSADQAIEEACSLGIEVQGD